MKKTTVSSFAVDNSSILYLSLIRKDHTNTYRFTMTMTDPVCPETLQRAVNRVYRRFPTVIAGFYPGFFHYVQVPAETAPLVQPDPGFLITMSSQEIKHCAFRVYYKDNTIVIEAFHAVTDGFGAVACLTTLVAEYLRLKHGISIPVRETLIELDQFPGKPELEDAYLQYAQGTPLRIPNRYAYQLPSGSTQREAVRTHTLRIPAKTLLDAAHAQGVSITTLIASVMAASIMEVQKQSSASARVEPVRIMVPADLRRMFPSRTLRNFILYVLPTMEPEDSSQPLSALMDSFGRQIQDQAEPKRLASIIAYNVKTQRAWYFRMMPRIMKCAIMRLAYRYFGESNSSLTLTNLGNVRLPEEMQPHVQSLDVILTPRARSPYNCAMISCNGLTTIQISCFHQDAVLEGIFLRNLESVLAGEHL